MLVRSNQALCFELVGDRFLRRMVRILVATVLREFMDGFVGSDVLSVMDVDGFGDKMKGRLLYLIQTCEREDTAKAAPSDGLFFVGATFRS